jgi:hypothetical protein
MKKAGEGRKTPSARITILLLTSYSKQHFIKENTMPHTPTPWVGLAALVAMFVLPMLPNWLFEGPRTIKHRSRRHICADCSAPWTNDHDCTAELREVVEPLRGELRRLDRTAALERSTTSGDGSEATTSKLIRTLSIGTTLTAMSLVGMTAVAQANDQPAGKQVARLPSERQVGESWRHRQAASQEQTAAAATLQRVQAREHFSIRGGTPAQTNIQVRQTESSEQSSWLLPSLGVLVAALMLVGGLAVQAARRTRRRARLEHAA